MPKKINPYIAVITVSILWGISNPIVKYSLNFVTPLTFLTIRFLIAAFVLYMLLLLLGKKNSLNLKKIGLKNSLYLFSFGLINGAIPLLFFFYGINLASSIETSIVQIMYPIFAIIGGFVFFKEKIAKKEIFGILIMLIGFVVALVPPILSESQQDANINLLGILFLFLYLICNVFAALVVKHILTLKKELFTSLQLTFFTSFSSALVIAPFGIYEILTFSYINYIPALFGIIYMAVASSVIAYYLYSVALAKLGVGETTLFTYLEPLFGIPVAIIFLQEAFSPYYLMGGALIVLGLYVSEHIVKTRRRRWERAKS